MDTAIPYVTPPPAGVVPLAPLGAAQPQQMPSQGVSLDTSTPAPTVSLMGAQGPQYSADHVDDLALKYNAALGDISPGADVVHSAIQNNGTDALAQSLANQQAVQAAQAKNSVIQDIANRNAGKVPSQDDIDTVNALTTIELKSPNLGTILDQAYAKKTTNLTATLSNQDNGQLDNALAANPDKTLDVLDRVENQGARNMIAGNILDTLQKKYDDSNVLTKGLAWAQTFVPFRSWQQANDFIKDGASHDFQLPGDSIAEQISYLNTLPPDEFKQKLQEGVDSAVSFGNYLDAQAFVQAVMSYSGDNQNWDNLMAGLDIASIIPVTELSKSMKGAAQVVNVAVNDLPRAAVVAGLPADAVKATLQSAAADGKFPSQVVRNLTDAENTVSSLARPQEAFQGVPLKAGGAATDRLQNAAMARADAANDLLFNTNRVERIDPNNLETLYSQAEQQLWDTFNHVNHQIVNVSRNAAEDNIGNVYSTTITFGRKDGGLFQGQMSAQAAASKWFKLKTNDFDVVQMDNGWGIQVHRNIDESQIGSGLPGVTISTDAKIPDTFANRFFGYIQGADLKLSKSQTQARGVAVMSSEHEAHLFQNFTEPVAALSKTERADLSAFIERDRDFVDQDGNMGRTRNTPFEFEDAYHQQNGHLPTEKQINAYWSYKQASDLDWLVRDADVMKQKIIQGQEHFTLGDGTEFDGKQITQLPRGHETPFKIAIVEPDGTIQKGNDLWSRSMDDQAWARVQAKLDDGYTAIQAADGYTKIGDSSYNFVLARNFKRDRIGMMNLNYRQGSHIVYKHPYFVKQANVDIDKGIARYTGDTAVANARSEVEGKFIEDKMNEGRKMYLRNDPKAESFFKENLPMWSWKQFDNAVKDGRINPAVPFKTVRSGTRTIDSHDLEASLRGEGHQFNQFVSNDAFDLNRNITGRFYGERDAQVMKTMGVEKNSIFELQDSPLVSPFDTMRMAASNMIDTHVFSDYRLKSVRDYTQQFGDVLEGNQADFDSNGMKYLYDPLYRSGADPNRVKTAEGVRKAILSLFNHNTIVDRQISMYKERIVQGMRDRFGDNGAWIADAALTRLGNTDSFMRAFAYHTKMGFFNPTQFFKQINTAVNVIAISPLHGIRGAAAYAPLTAMLYAKTPELARSVAERLAPVTKWSADELMEMTEAFKRSGWGHVGGDLAYIDELGTPEFASGLKGVLSKTLDAGTVFFKKGERLTRKMSFATAYSERKAASPTQGLTRADEAWILQRAKDLTGNMTRDSNAAYQQGYSAVATQFFGYQMRLAEQMFGNKLTGSERARLRVGMALMYGAPVAASMTFGVVPFRQWIADTMSEQGQDYHQIPGMELFMDGFAHQFIKSLGLGDLNVSDSYGPGGISSFYDLLKGNVDFQKMFLGASGGIIGQTMSYADPIVKGIHASLDMNDQTNYPVQWNDLLEPLRTISTVNSALRLQQAVNTQQWMSANGLSLTDTTPQEALIGAITGLSPERVTDAYNNIQALKSYKDMQNKAGRDVEKDYKLFIQALRSGDNDLADSYASRVKADGILGGLSMQQMNQAFGNAIKVEPLDQSVMKTWQQKFSATNISQYDSQEN